MATENQNTPKQGLSLDEAFAQLKASRGQAPAPQEHLEDEDGVDVVDEDLTDDEDFEADDEDSQDEDSDEDAQDEDSDEEADSDASEDKEIWEIEVDGEVVEVTTDELHKGYLRQNDYTRKRQADAKRAKELETEYQDKLTKLTQALEQNVSHDESQLAQLRQKYQTAKDDASRRNYHYQMLQLQQNITHRKQAKEQADALMKANQQAAREAYWKEQEEMLQAQFENWDQKKEELKTYLTSQGFEDLSMFAHANMATIVDKAKRFDELQQKREGVATKKIRRKVPAVLKPGQGEKKFSQDRSKIKALEARFAKTRSIKDAQALLQAKRGK